MPVVSMLGGRQECTAPSGRGVLRLGVEWYKMFLGPDAAGEINLTTQIVGLGLAFADKGGETDGLWRWSFACLV